MSASDENSGGNSATPPPHEDSTPPRSEAERPWWEDNSKWPFAAAALVFLYVLWASGSLDHALVNLGLNHDDCYRNGFGAVFCGDEWSEFKSNIGQ